MYISCGSCNQTGDFGDFTRTAVGGDLPKGSYQCPFCGTAWKIESEGPPKVLDSGFVMPAPLKIVKTDGRL